MLAVLLQEGRSDQSSAARGVATVLHREPLDLAEVLDRLECAGLVVREPDVGKDCWRTNFGAPAAA